jgi:hypothetical protein
MTNPKDTIKNRLIRAMMQIVESPDATIEEKLDAIGIILKVKERSTLRDRTARMQPKLARPSTSVLGTK